MRLSFSCGEAQAICKSVFSVHTDTYRGLALIKKVRGGIGMNIGIGLAQGFSYILFSSSLKFSLKGNLSPMLAMWIPNMSYLVIALVLYKLAPK